MCVLAPLYSGDIDNLAGNFRYLLENLLPDEAMWTEGFYLDRILRDAGMFMTLK